MCTRKKYSAHTIRNRSQKSAETLFLEPTKNKEKRLRKVASSKAQRNVRLGSLQATRPNSRKRCFGRACEKAEPQQVLCRSHCETAAGKMPKRRFWNPLKRKKCSAQTIRNRSQKTSETLLLEPTKNKEKRLRKVASSKAQRNVKLGSLQATRPNSEKRCFGRACEKAEPQQVLCRSHCETAARKCRNVAFGTPKNNEVVPQPLRNCSHQAKPKKAASGAHPKKQSRRFWNP